MPASTDSFSCTHQLLSFQFLNSLRGMRGPIRFHIIVMLLLGAPLRAPLVAQSTSSASIQGSVLARDGSPIPQAYVEILHVPTSDVHRSAANIEGHFHIPGLRVGGPYELKVSHIGYGTHRRTGIYLRLLEEVRVSVVLDQVTLPGDEVVVTGTRQGSLTTQTQGVSSQIGREQMAALPLPSASIEDALRLSPYMVGSSALGVNAVYNDVSLDGISVADPFGLQRAENLPGGMQISPVGVQALEEVRVDFSPFDVRRGGFTGASIAAVSRSGSNTRTWSAFAQGAGGWARGPNPDDGRHDLRGYFDGRAGFNVGGAVVPSKAFYFLSAEVAEQRLPIERRFGAPSTRGSVYSFPAGAAAQFVSTLKRSGYDPGRMDIVTLGQKMMTIFGRIDLALTPQHQFSVRVNSLVTRGDTPPPGTTVFASGALARTWAVTHSIALEVNSVWNSRVSNELLAGYTSRRFSVTPTGDGSPFVDVVVTDTRGWWNHLTAGSEVGGRGKDVAQDHVEVRDAVSITSGAHLWTIGLHGELNWITNRQLSARWGSYTFATLNDLSRGAPSGYEYRYPLEGTSPDGVAWRIGQISAFLQDEWRPSSHVSLSAGVRVDLPFLLDRPRENAAVREAFLPLGYSLSTSTLPAMRAMISPRVGLSVYPKEDRTVRLRGGIGLFTGRIPYAWFGNLYEGTGLEYGHVKRSERVPAFVADPARQPSPMTDTNLSATSEVVVAASDFVLPQELRWTLAFDQDLPWNLRLSVEGVFSRTINGVVFKNLNLAQTGTMDAERGGDPRAVYGWAFPIGRWQYSRNDGRFTDVMLMTNATEGTSTFLTMQLQRRPGPDGVFASLAYTYADTRDLNSGAWDNAYDQWRYNPAAEPNTPRLNYSSFDRTHRLAVAVAVKHDWGGGHATTLGLVYTGASGIPFSYVYDGDLNGDGESFNDLFYIPGTSTEILLVNEDGGLTIPTDPGYNELFSFIAHDPYLSTHRRQIAERNGARTPWTHLLDLRCAHTLPMTGGNTLEVSAELLNVMNLLDPSWGQVQTVPYQVVPILRFWTRDSRGRPWFRWAPRTTPFVAEPLLSRWRLRLGVRLSF